MSVHHCFSHVLAEDGINENVGKTEDIENTVKTENIEGVENTVKTETIEEALGDGIN
jgi:hypothetical protein